ncbi:head-tail adaptor protein [Peribacillus sp. FSL E2-0218]|uniref:phage head completion protein n=1 Tax=Peribacillus TaxID=2675229 RepID=UPI0030ED0820
MPKRLINRWKYRATFYEYVGNDGPTPGEKMKSVLYECWAVIEEVWAKDLELAKANGTLNDITIKIRDPRGAYQPTNKHYVSVSAPIYKDKHFNIKHVAPDFKNRGEIRIVAEVRT